MIHKFTHSTWSNHTTYGVHGHVIDYDIQDSYGQIPSTPRTDELLAFLWNKTIISIYDPLFKLITNSHISGQLLLDNGKPTKTFNTIDSLAIPRGFGANRQIRLLKINSFNQPLYYPLVDNSVSIGFKNSFLEEDEKRFYGNFVFTEFEPTSDAIRDVIVNAINSDNRYIKILFPTDDWTISVQIK